MYVKMIEKEINFEQYYDINVYNKEKNNILSKKELTQEEAHMLILNLKKENELHFI